MQPAVLISCFLVTTILQTGQLALIETQEAVWAAVGDQASLSCRLTEDKDVLQVTWQKVLPGGETNLATYTKKFGSRVRPDLEEKMDFQCEDLQSCSMVIRKVTEQDEACYRCLFNTYPRGALMGKTCLKLYELHGPIIDVRNSPPESVVSCSATGRPAPTVTLTVPQQNLTFSQYNTSRVTNTNGTVTVTTTALLSASSSTQVRCSVSVNSAAPRELLVTVPGLTETPGDDGLDVESGSKYTIVERFLIAGFVLLVCVFVAALIFVLLRKKAEKRESEDSSYNKPFVLEPPVVPTIIDHSTHLKQC